MLKGYSWKEKFAVTFSAFLVILGIVVLAIIHVVEV